MSNKRNDLIDAIQDSVEEWQDMNKNVKIDVDEEVQLRKTLLRIIGKALKIK